MRLKLRAEARAVDGDRCPYDTWRVTLYLGPQWMIYREWSEGLYGEKNAEAQQQAEECAASINAELNRLYNIEFLYAMEGKQS